MFSELEKYKTDHFFLDPDSDIVKECNAPAGKGGVYIVYALARGKIEMVFIGASNDLAKDLKDEPSWMQNLTLEQPHSIDIYWYVTEDKKNHDKPEDVERTILQIHINLYGELPRWNGK